MQRFRGIRTITLHQFGVAIDCDAVMDAQLVAEAKVEASIASSPSSVRPVRQALPGKPGREVAKLLRCTSHDPELRSSRERYPSTGCTQIPSKVETSLLWRVQGAFVPRAACVSRTHGVASKVG
jgi:hypothetical protein